MKEQVEQIIATSIESVESGHMDALQAYVELKAIAATVAQATKQIEEEAMTELLNYPKGRAEIAGAKVEARSSAGRYNFKAISDWVSMQSRLKAIESDAKEAAKLAEKGQVLYDEDGVQVEPADYTPGKESIFVTFPKS